MDGRVMTRLKTYTKRGSLALVADDWREGDPPSKLEPGMQVKTPSAGGFGMIVAMTDDEVSVVWSTLPRAPYDQSSYIEAGYVYAPHVPMQVTPTIFSPEDFKPHKGVMTRYGKKAIRSDFYGTVSVLDITSGST